MRIPFSRKEDKFFALLRQSAANISAISAALVDLMEEYENLPDKVARIKDLEHVGDEIMHTIMALLHSTFVTPIDKEDITMLASRMDDVVDAIDEAAHDMIEYHIEQPTPYAIEIARIILRCSKALEPSLDYLRVRGTQLEKILHVKDELNILEEEADHIASKGMAEIFDTDDVVEIIKWRDIYLQLEGATDRFEDIAGILESIVIKYT